MINKTDSGIKCYKVCCHNVTNVQCKPDLGTTSNNDASTSEKTAQKEFLAMTEINLRDGTILTMSYDFKAAY